MIHLKKILWIFVAAFAFSASPTLAVTDTVYVQKKIIDTLYVASPPDTVYMQESVVHETNTEPEKNEFLIEYSTDTIPPANKFYLGAATSINILAICFGAFIIDLDWEKENSYRGSLIFNLSSIILFYDYHFSSEDATWDGFRSIISPGIGYRQYLLTSTVTKANPKKRKVKHRNTPLNSVSFYIQALENPTFKIAYDGKHNDSKKGSFDVGSSTSATLGILWNSENFLWNYGLTIGYQYWSDNARHYLSWEKSSGEKFNYHVLN